MFVVLQWFYNDREGKAIFPELSNAFGPFPDSESAKGWIAKADTWGGWGRYEYSITELHTPNSEEPK